MEKTYKITIITENPYLDKKIEKEFLSDIQSISLEEFDSMKDKAEQFALDILNQAKKFLKFFGSVVF